MYCTQCLTSYKLVCTRSNHEFSVLLNLTSYNAVYTLPDQKLFDWFLTQGGGQVDLVVMWSACLARPANTQLDCHNYQQLRNSDLWKENG